MICDSGLSRILSNLGRHYASGSSTTARLHGDVAMHFGPIQEVYFTMLYINSLQQKQHCLSHIYSYTTVTWLCNNELQCSALWLQESVNKA